MVDLGVGQAAILRTRNRQETILAFCSSWEYTMMILGAPRSASIVAEHGVWWL